MSTITERIAELQKVPFYQKSKFTYQEFEQSSTFLKNKQQADFLTNKVLVDFLESDLESEQRIELFNHFDNEKTGFISKEYIENLIAMVTNSEENTPENKTDDRITGQQSASNDFGTTLDIKGSRGSIFFDPQKKRISYTPATDRSNLQSLRKEKRTDEKIQTQDKKISTEILNSLTPDKLSELKYIFQICDTKNTGEISYSEVVKLLDDMKTTGTKEEILTVFSVVKDDQTNKISMEVFGRLLGDLERRLFELFSQRSMFGVSIADDHATKGGNDLEEGKFNHGIEEEEDEEEGQIRISSLEFELKRRYESQDILEQLNEDYCQQITELERRVTDLEIDRDAITNKNRQIVNLESTCKGLENTIDSLNQQFHNLQLEKADLQSSYDKLSELLKTSDIYNNQGSESVDGSDLKTEKALKATLEKVKLDLEIKTKELENRNQYSQKLENMIDELRNNLSLSQELISEMRLKEDEYKKKYARLEEEYENTRRDNSLIRASFRKGSNTEILSRELGAFNLINERVSLFRYGPSQTIEEGVTESFTTKSANAQQGLESISEEQEERTHTEHKGTEDSKLEGTTSEKPRTELEKFELKSPLKITQTQEATSPTRIRKSNQIGLNSLRRLPTSTYQEGMFARDYLNLRENPIVMKMLQTFKEDTDNLMCFSDQVIRINQRENKEKRVLLVTTEAIYNLHPRKNFQVLRRIDLKKVHKLTVPENSAVLLAIHVKGEYDYLLEVFRRINLLLFLIEVFNMKSLPRFKMSYEASDLAIVNRNANAPKKLEQYDKSSLNPELQTTYQNAKKQKKPKDFIPILGGRIMETTKTQDREYCFKIIFPNSQTEVILSAVSQTEKNEWIEVLKQVQTAPSNKKTVGEEIQSAQKQIPKKLNV